MFVRLLLGYGILLALWPLVGDAHRTAFCAFGNVGLSRFGSAAHVRFDPVDGPTRFEDTRMTLGLGDPPVSRREDHTSAFLHSYLPSSLFVALVLATPVPRRRRWLALPVGLALLHAFVAVKLALHLVLLFSTSPESGIRLGESTRSGLDRLFYALVVSWFPLYVVPILVWIPTTVRRRDLARLAEGLRGGRA